jgi:feruloyl esterase
VNLPGLCAVSVQVQSISNSTFGFGLFLPDEWNGRFLATGNGGFGGGINYVDMVRAQAIGKKREILATDRHPGRWSTIWLCNDFH